mmetsp:Transcript_9991/g.13187  ORF Transcript_9991/g.13187 Transcript_9991/m.13187 type:complete len:366 (-) Transcript_9991:1335-2432(-)
MAIQKVFESPEGRTIGYAITEEAAFLEEERNRAIVLFCSLSGNSAAVEYYNLQKLKCRFVCVDRPGCGATSQLDTSSKQSSSSISLDRIHTHVNDVLNVLKQEQISQVWILGVCIGHPFAIELTRRLCCDSHNISQDDDQGLKMIKIELEGVSLVAPFVSTACPTSLGFARFGTYVPSAVLYAGTETMSYFKYKLLPYLLSPRAVENLITEDEKTKGGWKQEDYEQTAQLIVALNERNKYVFGEEARLGVDSSWQTEICEKAAKEVIFCRGGGFSGDIKDEQPLVDSNKESVPICIHAIREDRTTPFSSVEWIAERCYGGRDRIVEETEDIHSHEVMTFLGGPLRNPLLLYKIAKYWGLLKEETT